MLRLLGQALLLSGRRAWNTTEGEEVSDSAAECIRRLGGAHGPRVVVEGRHCVPGEGVRDGVLLALLVSDVEIKLQELLLQPVEGLRVNSAEGF